MVIREDYSQYALKRHIRRDREGHFLARRDILFSFLASDKGTPCKSLQESED